MKKLTKIVTLGAVATASANAGALPAPDTADITGTIVAYGGAAIAVATAYVLWPIAVKAFKLIRASI